MDTKHCTVDGWVDAPPTPGPHGTATFDLVVRPAAPDAIAKDAPDTIVSCTSEVARITEELLTGVQPSDLVHVTGTLVQSAAPGEPVRLTGDALEVLDTAVVPILRDMVMDRCGDYCVVFNADTAVPVFTALGQWVGLAETPTPSPPSSTSTSV
ncbi:hypothetical protein AB0I82_35420 [Streptomyces sp. NPDC050315]|uniref:hypothetical protein n=1 Tax=Streptomyces sp. NPDC050315 TaxID=3155039 RepID=UPI00341D8BDA